MFIHASVCTYGLIIVNSLTSVNKCEENQVSIHSTDRDLLSV